MFRCVSCFGLSKEPTPHTWRVPSDITHSWAIGVPITPITKATGMPLPIAAQRFLLDSERPMVMTNSPK